jgi:hypothetical protein
MIVFIFLDFRFYTFVLTNYAKPKKLRPILLVPNIPHPEAICR